MNFKEITKFLGVAGSIAAPFTPIGGGLVLASQALDKFSEFDTQSIKEDFIGLETLGKELAHMVEIGDIDADKLRSISESLIKLSSILNNFTNMVK